MGSRISSGLLASVFIVVFIGAAGCDGADIPGAHPMTVGPAGSTTFEADRVGGGGGGTGAQIDPQAVGQAICTKFVTCLGSGGEITDAVMQQCVDMVASYMGMVVDPDAFVACFNALTCEDLQETEKIGEYMQECLDLDEESVECTANGVIYCTNQGVCKEIDCQTLCDITQGEMEICCECSKEPPPQQKDAAVFPDAGLPDLSSDTSSDTSSSDTSQD